MLLLNFPNISHIHILSRELTKVRMGGNYSIRYVYLELLTSAATGGALYRALTSRVTTSKCT
jgi:hypothetical protein